MEEQLVDYLHYLQIERGSSNNAWRSYERDLRKYVAFLQEQGPHSWDGVDCCMTTELLQSLHEEQQASASVIRMVSNLRGFRQFLRQERSGEHNPMQHIDSPKKVRKLPSTLSVDEMTWLVETPDASKPLDMRNRTILEVIYAAGLRVSGLIEIKLGDLHLSIGLLRTIGKGDKKRIIPLGDYAIQWIERYMNGARPQLIKSHPNETHLFVNHHGKSLSKQGIRKNLKQIVREAQVEKGTTLHALRHSFATRLLENSTDLRIVQELLRHADISTTQIYTHIIEQRMADAYKEHFPRT